VTGGVARYCIVAGGVLGAVAVGAGAFGAHGLAGVLEATGQAANWETASRYALIHAVALVAVGCLAGLPAAAAVQRTLATAGWCFATGVAIFSGCLWTLALTRIGVLGAIVPIGGSLLIAGWIAIAAAGSWLRRPAPSGDAH